MTAGGEGDPHGAEWRQRKEQMPSSLQRNQEPGPRKGAKADHPHVKAAEPCPGPSPPRTPRTTDSTLCSRTGLTWAESRKLPSYLTLDV